MTQGPLPLILLAANEHPDEQFRGHLWSCLDAWLEAQSPAINHDELDAILSHHKGTFLEPFRLEAGAKRTAIFLSRLALADASSASRFRVVSQDSIGNSGGLVITSNKNAFYSERYELGKNRLKKSDLRFFAPSTTVDGPMKANVGEDLHALMYSDDHGIYIEFPKSLLNLVDWDLNRGGLKGELSSNSHIGPKKQSLYSVGMTVEGTDKGIRLAVKSPESLIRFSTYVVQSQSIRLIAKTRFQLTVQLPNSAEGPAPITVTANDDFASEWMDVKDLGAPSLDAADIQKITTWSFHHMSWLD